MDPQLHFEHVHCARIILLASVLPRTHQKGPQPVACQSPHRPRPLPSSLRLCLRLCLPQSRLRLLLSAALVALKASPHCPSQRWLRRTATR